MKGKKLIALLSALAMLTTTAPVFASGEDAPPPIEPEDVEIEEPIVLEELDEPIVSDELAIADEAAEAYAVEEASESAETRLRGQIDSYEALQSAIDAAIDGDTVKLTGSFDIGNKYISINKSLTIDLNGYTLTASHANGTILVYGDNSTTLTIVDNSDDKNGKVLNTANCAVWVYIGNLTLESGTIETSATNYTVKCAADTSMTMDGGTVKGQSYYAIQNVANSVLKINGGVVESLAGIQAYGILEITGGTVIATNNIAVVARAGSDVKMTSGTVKGSTGIYIYNDGTVTIGGGTVTGKSYGINSSGTVTIDDCTVTGGKCGIYNSGIVTIDSGTVETDYSDPSVDKNSKGKTAYGICLNDSAELIINGGTVRGVRNNPEPSDRSDYPDMLYGIFGFDNSKIIINGGTVESTSANTETEKYPYGTSTYGIYSYGDITINNDSTVTANGTAITGHGHHHGTRYIINGGTITGGNMGIYHPQDGYMEINGGTITGGLTGIEIRAGEMVVNGGTITGIERSFKTAENGSGSTTIGAGIAVVQHDTEMEISLTVKKGEIYGYVPLYEGNVHNNPQAAIYKVTISLEGGVFKFVDIETDAKNPEREAVITEDVDHYMTGGIYSGKIPYDYIHPDYYRRHLHDNVYGGIYDDHFEVTKPNFTVDEIARIPDAEVDLVDLIQNDGIDGTPFSTYKVVLKKSSEEHTAAMNEAIDKNTEDKNTERTIFDILVKKTDDAGKETDITEGILEQKVTVTLTKASDLETQNVHVYYRDKKDNDTVKEIEGVVIAGNTVTFTAPVLSTYAITYNPIEPTENNVAKEIGIVFSPVAEGSNQYYITLKPLEKNKMLNRYMSSDIAFKIECTDGRVIYEIEPAEYMNATLFKETEHTDGNSREYHFEMDGINKPDATCVFDEGITIGTITFTGYGTFDFRVDTDFVTEPEHTVNIANTAEFQDNIVAHYTEKDMTAQGYGKIIVNEDVTKCKPPLKDNEAGTIHATLSPDIAVLTVNIAFNNTVKDNESAYQDMTLTISGGQLSDDIVIKLGTDSEVPEGTTVAFDEEASAYQVVIGDTLWRNVLYSVKLEGAGYRTAHCTVHMTNDKTLNFWNNVKDKTEFIEAGKESSKVTKNFLAGDIVKDNNINIYDLSAVVSYFGEDNLVSEHKDYAKYDLNRDGVIDSKDVAYVLVSWDE